MQSKTPVLKWAGGKTQLLDQLQERMPDHYNTYFEPFIGGAALFLSVSPQIAVINDINEQLVNLYNQLKTSYEAFIAIINEWDSVPCDKEYYLSMRTKYNNKILNHELDTECAALMVWLNKHCFNGLYRVNSKGLFNVPYNNKINGASINEENITAIGEYMKCSQVSITNLDFEEVCKNVQSWRLCILRQSVCT